MDSSGHSNRHKPVIIGACVVFGGILLYIFSKFSSMDVASSSLRQLSVDSLGNPILYINRARDPIGISSSDVSLFDLMKTATSRGLETGTLKSRSISDPTGLQFGHSQVSCGLIRDITSNLCFLLYSGYCRTTPVRPRPLVVQVRVQVQVQLPMLSLLSQLMHWIPLAAVQRTTLSQGYPLDTLQFSTSLTRCRITPCW